MNTEQLIHALAKSFGETMYMVAWSFVFAVIFGGLIGLLLYLSASPYFIKNNVINTVGSFLINMIRSIPFIILLVVLLPVGKLIVGTSIGSKSVIFPLTVSAVAFFARLAENAFQEVDKGVVEAAVASGAKPFAIVREIIIPESLPVLIKNMTVTIISLVGYSAMAGTVGGGGVGDLAIRYGYQRYNIEVMIICIVLLIVLVQLLQMFGDAIANAYVKKRR